MREIVPNGFGSARLKLRARSLIQGLILVTEAQTRNPFSVSPSGLTGSWIRNVATWIQTSADFLWLHPGQWLNLLCHMMARFFAGSIRLHVNPVPNRSDLLAIYLF